MCVCGCRLFCEWFVPRGRCLGKPWLAYQAETQTTHPGPASTQGYPYRGTQAQAAGTYHNEHHTNHTCSHIDVKQRSHIPFGVFIFFCNGKWHIQKNISVTLRSWWDSDRIKTIVDQVFCHSCFLWRLIVST